MNDIDRFLMHQIGHAVSWLLFFIVKFPHLPENKKDEYVSQLEESMLTLTQALNEMMNLLEKSIDSRKEGGQKTELTSEGEKYLDECRKCRQKNGLCTEITQEETDSLIEKMKEQGLIEVFPDGQAQLTPQGEEYLEESQKKFCLKDEYANKAVKKALSKYGTT